MFFRCAPSFPTKDWLTIERTRGLSHPGNGLASMLTRVVTPYANCVLLFRTPCSKLSQVPPQSSYCSMHQDSFVFPLFRPFSFFSFRLGFPSLSCCLQLEVGYDKEPACGSAAFPSGNPSNHSSQLLAVRTMCCRPSLISSLVYYTRN